MPKSTQNHLFISLGIFVFYAASLLWPEGLWATHYVAFLPSSAKTVILLLPLACIGLAFSQKEKSLETQSSSVILDRLLPVIFMLLFDFLFFSFPIVGDYYGNARNFLPELEKTVTELPAEFWSSAFSFEFKPGNGRRGVFHLMTYAAYLGEMTYGEAFRWVDMICGALFVGIWSAGVLFFVKKWAGRILLLLTGLTAPFLLIFFGHIETYAPVFLILMAWWMLLFLHLHTQNRVQLWLLLPLLLMAIRLHTLFYLLSPALALAFAHHYAGNHPQVKKILTPKGIFLYLFLPIFILGMFLYFVVFQDFNDPRGLNNFEDIDRLFLPLISPEAPLDNYNLLSISHIWDYVNAILMWSPVAVFLAIYLPIQYKKHINWQHPTFLISFFSFLLFAVLLFAINPLFSMPMDWDLFCFPAPILMMTLLALIRQLEGENLPIALPITALGLTFLTLPTFIVHQSKPMMSEHLEEVGIRVYKTYYEHSSTYLLYAVQLPESTPELYFERKERMLARLKPYAHKGKDQKYAELLMDEAANYLSLGEFEKTRTSFIEAIHYDPSLSRFDPIFWQAQEQLQKQDYQLSEADFKDAKSYLQKGLRQMRQEKDFVAAKQNFRLALFYNPSANEVVLRLMESHFLLEEFEQAHDYALNLVTQAFPSREQSLRIALHCALEAALYEDALKYCKALLEMGDDAFIQQIYVRLKAQDRVEDLKLLFRNG